MDGPTDKELQDAVNWELYQASRERAIKQQQEQDEEDEMFSTETIKKHKERKTSELLCPTCRKSVERDEDSVLPLAIAACVVFVVVLFLACWPKG
jgi:endogenous inhibitor of DNA gyrase (YacG/DUF329 family)